MYDLAIIGGGPAGYSAAFRASELGLKAVLFEFRDLGGTCLNRGCVPTKYLAHVSEIYYKGMNAEKYGIHINSIDIDETKLFETERRMVEQLRKQLEQQLIASKVEIINSKAKILSESKVEAEGNLYECKNILIATGSVPKTTLNKSAVTSDEILKLDRIPKTMTIIGGGVVAVEFARIYQELGTKVNICIRGERILRKWDKDIATGLTQSFKKRGIIINNRNQFDDNTIYDSEIVLSANGRRANLNNVVPDSIRIDMKDDGILVDDSCRTSVSHIYAAGDVIADSPMLAHIAMEQGKRVVDSIVDIQLEKPSIVANCIYTDPEIASVGFSEQEATEKGMKIAVIRQPMFSNARTLISDGERGFVKLIADMNTQRIVGAHLMCERATDIITELVLAINADLTVSQLKNSVRPHPSYCEAVTDALSMLSRRLH